jgi:hypothetical protein
MAQRPLPIHAVGRPAPWPLVATSFVLALLGWAAASAAAIRAVPDLAAGRLGAESPVLALHLAALVFFPFAVTGAAWHTLPVMLRNHLRSVRLLWLALPLLAGGVPLAAGIALGADTLVWAGTGLLAAALAVTLHQLAGLILHAPREKTLVASRIGVALSALHLVAAFVLGAAVFSAAGPAVWGVPYERMVLVHLLLAALGWLTLLILAVGRTLAPMLALAPAAPPRRLPWLELGFAAGLWLFAGGLAAGVGAIAAAGGAVVAIAVGRFCLQVAGVLRTRRLDAVEGPLAHLTAGVVFLAQSAAVGFAALAGAVDERRGTGAFVLLLVVGWAAGVILGHLGKLLSLSAWTGWPPGPRPGQAAFYPRRLWEAEAAAFAVGVELLAVSVLVRSEPLGYAGAGLVVGSAAAALAGAVTTVLRARAGRLDRSPARD